ncbi:MAG: sigma-70 family RNA polymerase sigma factor [Clostridia bacterium]|jgi:RNA polymerase sigma-70 factor (ECF subfamily)|nr:sigma-70 family RNA polymerase sigma factor [Clostridia bacterium]
MKPIEQIYRAYFTDVYRYCLKLTGNADEAEELTGETFLKAMQRLHGFRGDCELRVWLCQIAKNKYLSERRKQRPEPLSDTLESPADSPEDLAVRTVEAERASEAVHRLDEPYKEVFLLRVYGEMPFEDIGKLFGKTANWACVTFHRAKQRVKAELEE